MEFVEIIKCPACGKKEKIKSRKQYCSSCGCYLPPILKEKEEIYHHPYSYFPLQTQATPTQRNSNLDIQVQLQLQRLESKLRAYETQINQSMQSHYILNNIQPYRTGKDGEIIYYTWTHTE